MTGSPSAVAARLLAAYDQRATIERIVASDPEFDVAAAYEVLALIEAERRERGWRPVGRKIGFTNQTIWELFGVAGPMWARIWDRTLILSAGGAASVALAPFVRPRIEPEVVFALSSSPPASDDPEAVLACVEWFAAGFEIVQCPFAGWRFDAAECTAAFGLHGALVVGTPTFVGDRDLATLAKTLATFDVALSRDGAVVDRGNGADVLGSPASALARLVGILADQPRFEPLAPGEIITTGTLTDAHAVAAGEVWSSGYGSLDVEGLRISFT